MLRKSELTSKYPRVAHKLKKQNTTIYDREKQLSRVKKEFAGTKGIFVAKQRKELQEQAEQLQTQIANMKQNLSSIVRYKNVKEFLAEYKASRAEYGDYRKAIAKWEEQPGNKAESDSIKAKLQRKTQKVKERENSRQNHHYRSDRGGRSE